MYEPVPDSDTGTMMRLLDAEGKRYWLKYGRGKKNAEDIENEACVIPYIRNSRVATVNYVFVSPELQLILMEEEEGSMDLFDCLVRHPPCKKDCIVILNHVHKILSDLHNVGFVHRDIKPENLLIKQSGGLIEMKAIDFGFTTNVASTKLCGSGYYAATTLSYEKSFDVPSMIFLDWYAYGIMCYVVIMQKDPVDVTSDEVCDIADAMGGNAKLDFVICALLSTLTDDELAKWETDTTATEWLKNLSDERMNTIKQFMTATGADSVYSIVHDAFLCTREPLFPVEHNCTDQTSHRPSKKMKHE
jgi:serine/threonine protein kinase